MAAGSRLPSMFQFWLSGAGGARGLFDIDDGEIIYEGTITQLHRYPWKLTLPLFGGN